MAYKKRFTRYVADLIRHLPPQLKPALRALTDRLTADPYLGKALTQDLLGFYSIKHNRYRVIYEIDVRRGFVIIHFLGQRENVYDVFSKLLKEIKKRQ